MFTSLGPPPSRSAAVSCSTARDIFRSGAASLGSRRTQRSALPAWWYVPRVSSIHPHLKDTRPAWPPSLLDACSLSLLISWLLLPCIPGALWSDATSRSPVAQLPCLCQEVTCFFKVASPMAPRVLLSCLLPPWISFALFLKLPAKGKSPNQLLYLLFTFLIVYLT